MEFNNIWTKQRNDELRKMLSAKKSVDDIRKKFGILLEYHPKKKFCYSNKLQRFNMFCNEIYINKINKIDYYLEIIPSLYYTGKVDYVVDFSIGNNKYVLIFFYLIDKKESYNILFTTNEQYLLYKSELEMLLSKKTPDKFNDNDFIKLSSILEKETLINEPLKIINSISYIILELWSKNLDGELLSIGETKNKKKIDFYRNIIKNSFDDIDEIEDLDSFGNKTYYYKKK